jgi:hypothetical protein
MYEVMRIEVSETTMVGTVTMALNERLSSDLAGWEPFSVIRNDFVTRAGTPCGARWDVWLRREITQGDLDAIRERPKRDQQAGS